MRATTKLISCSRCLCKFCRPSPVGQTPKYCGDCRRKVRNETSRRHALANPDRVRRSQRESVIKNWGRKKAYNRGYENKKYRENPSFRMAKLLRNRLKETLKGAWKSESALSLLGMDLHEFQIYIRGQFKPEMTWENYGPVWHLDHVRPCASFDLTDPEQQKICFRWDNYQPLFAKENLQKGDKWQPLPS